MVGCGNIFRLAHAHAWKNVRDARVVATCDLDSDRAEEARKTLGAERAYTRYEELLEREKELDVVDLCTPSFTHAALSLPALKKGLHVFCEKPIATNLEDAEQVVRQASRNGARVFVGQTRRFDDRWLEMKKQVDTGRIGIPLFIRRTERSWAGFGPDSWYWDQDKSGGVVFDLGIHVVDLFSWFLAPAKPVRVFAKARRFRPETRKPGGCYDYALIQVEYEDNRHGTAEVSWAHPKAITPFHSTLEVTGTKGRLDYSDQDSQPAVAVSDAIEVPRYSTLLSTFPHVFTRQIDHFLTCIRKRETPQVTLHDAYSAVQVVSAAVRSAESGRPVDL